jgi:RNA polymerase sigma-70 factor (ECF subfamily)
MHTSSLDHKKNQNVVPDWEDVYEETLPKIFHFFCYRVGDKFVAEDLTSLTFEKAWVGRERFRNDIGSFTQWIFGIARNVVVDHYRNDKKEVPIRHVLQEAYEDSPEIHLQRNSDFSRLTKLLAKLPERDRELISFKYGSELTNRAIAELTGLSETNVGTILFRLVRKLRSEWEDDR